MSTTDHSALFTSFRITYIFWFPVSILCYVDRDIKSPPLNGACSVRFRSTTLIRHKQRQNNFTVDWIIIHVFVFVLIRETKLLFWITLLIYIATSQGYIQMSHAVNQNSKQTLNEPCVTNCCVVWLRYFLSRCRSINICYELHTDATLFNYKPMVAMAELFQWYETTLQKKSTK